MPQVINTNVMSLNSQRQLNRSQTSMMTSVERLSSGLRINRAKDDAAGLAIAEKFTSQIRGLNQAIRNANDGISLVQTADGAMDEMSNAMQRMRELAIQAANGTYDAVNRSALNLEFAALGEEVQRIAEDTDFNGVKILLSARTLGMQVGWEAYQSIDVSTINILEAGGVTVGLTDGTYDIRTSANAQTAIGQLDSALQFVAARRAKFGAQQNRMESAIRNLDNVSENQSAARSRIRDADFAQETAELTRTQILQQAGVAMLAQANQLPQNVLQLLG